MFLIVSTHSRPKAAAAFGRSFFRCLWFQHTAARRRLSLQLDNVHIDIKFQHTAARRRLIFFDAYQDHLLVSTHSRPKAADAGCYNKRAEMWFQHTAARRRLVNGNAKRTGNAVSTHSRPKAAARKYRKVPAKHSVSTHSRPKAAAYSG